MSNRNITLIEGGKIISVDDDDVANTLNTFFDNAVKTSRNQCSY